MQTMKTADARLIACALFALALSLPLSAWVLGRAVAPALGPPVPSGAISSSPAGVGRYQFSEGEHGYFRMDTETGQLYDFRSNGWYPWENRLLLHLDAK